MEVTTNLKVNSNKEAIWAVLCDIENAEKNISGIDRVEILNKPEQGMVGLKWKETRTMFGKEATEVMWITEAVENKYYRTRAESHGSIYKSTMSLEEKEGYCLLSMGFKGEAVSLGAKVSNFIFSKMIKKSLIKTMLVDLEDIKGVVEAKYGLGYKP